MLKGKQARYLRSLANSIDHRYLLGKGEPDESFIDQLDKGLEANELIKVGLLRTSALSTKELSELLSSRLNCEIVDRIGRVIVLYRESKTKKRIILPRE